MFCIQVLALPQPSTAVQVRVMVPKGDWQLNDPESL
jgi:hypothetical protein